MSENVFTIIIKGPGMDVERELPEDKVLEVLAIAFPRTSGPLSSANAARVTNGGSQVANPPQGTKSKQANVAIGEFLADLNIDNNADRIAAIALYLKEQLDQPLISRDELPSWFQRAGETIPKNLVRDLTTAIKQKVVAEDHTSAGHYYITGTGEKKLRSTDKSSS